MYKSEHLHVQHSKLDYLCQNHYLCPFLDDFYARHANRESYLICRTVRKLGGFVLLAFLAKTEQVWCKSGLRYTTSFEVVNLVLGLKMCMQIHIMRKTNSFWKNCNNIPDEIYLQMKALSVPIVPNKICLGIFWKKLLLHLWKWHFLKLMTINLLKIIFPGFLSPSILSAYMPPFLFFNYNISNHDFSSQIPILWKTKRTII